jgi:hypothetical protein
MTSSNASGNVSFVINRLRFTISFVINHETGKEDFYFMKLNQFYDDVTEYDSLHDLLDRYYDARALALHVHHNNGLINHVMSHILLHHHKIDLIS